MFWGSGSVLISHFRKPMLECCSKSIFLRKFAFYTQTEADKVSRTRLLSMAFTRLFNNLSGTLTLHSALSCPVLTDDKDCLPPPPPHQEPWDVFPLIWTLSMSWKKLLNIRFQPQTIAFSTEFWNWPSKNKIISHIRESSFYIYVPPYLKPNYNINLMF